MANKKKINPKNKPPLSHYLFEIGITVKFINGILEVIGAVILFIISQKSVGDFIKKYLAHQILLEPNEFLARYLLHLSNITSVKMQILIGIYLLVHGGIKIWMVISLWKKKLWAYPAAAVILTLLTIYQIYLIASTHSIFQFILTLIDIAVLILLRFEYNRVKNELAGKKNIS